MRILFDQGTPVGIKTALSDHTVKTAREQGWSDLINGDLLRAAVTARFDIFLTTDKNLRFQQDLSKYDISIIVLGASRWKVVKLRLREIVAAVNAARPGSYTQIEIPER